MPSPFPGMDPYLEHPALWPGVHLSLIVALQSALGPKLRPKYYVAIEERVYVAEPADGELLGVPDAIVIGARPRSDSPNGAEGYPSSPSGDGHEQDEQRPGVLTVELPIPDRVREAYLEVRVPASHEVVTVVELLSPSNKRPGEGRQQYEAKRAKT
ncbi:MAG: DUF4058 family protein, partial [Chloroflexota bacterium]